MLCCAISISFVSQRLGKLSPFRVLYLIWFVCLGFSTCHILGAGTLALAAWSWIWRFKDALLSNVEYQYSLVQWHLNNKTSSSVGLQVILAAKWSPYQGEIQRKSEIAVVQWLHLCRQLWLRPRSIQTKQRRSGFWCILNPAGIRLCLHKIQLSKNKLHANGLLTSKCISGKCKQYCGSLIKCPCRLGYQSWN